MNLSRTKDALKAIEKNRIITIEQILNLYHDIYEDVKSETDMVLEQQAAGDPNEVIARLCWMARTTARICRKNEEELFATGAQARWEASKKKLDEACVQLEVEERRAEQIQKQLAEGAEEISKLRTFLERTVEQQKQNEEELEVLKSRKQELSTLVLEQEGKKEKLKKQCASYENIVKSDQLRMNDLTEKWELLNELWKKLGDDKILMEDWLRDPGEMEELKKRFGQHIKQIDERIQWALEEYRLLISFLEKGEL